MQHCKCCHAACLLQSGGAALTVVCLHMTMNDSTRTARSSQTHVSPSLIGVVGSSKKLLSVQQYSAILATRTSAALTCTGSARQEIDDLCEEWQPEPLHKPLPNSQALPEPPVISRCCGILKPVSAHPALQP